MRSAIRAGMVGLLVTATLALSPRTTYAQSDFSGEWRPVRNQDNTENPLVGD
jgi:hypothetical protein